MNLSHTKIEAKLSLSVCNNFALSAIKKQLRVDIVNDCKDISKDVPGPDLGIATIDHEDIENGDNKSEIIEIAINRSKCN